MPNSISGSSGYVSSAYSSSQDQKAKLHDVVFLEYLFTDREEEEAEKANRDFTFMEAKEAKHFLDVLKPHSNNPRTLIIRHFSGAEFPDWWGDPSFTALTALELINCEGIPDCLPQSLGLLPALASLTIQRAPIRDFSIRAGIDEAPRYPSLHQLKLIDMYFWEAWHGLRDDDFPKLHQLELSHCWSLREVPCFKSLVDFSMECCESLTSLPTFPSLRTLQIIDCDGLVELPCLESLVDLSMESCNHLMTSLPTLPSLNNLDILRCFVLKEIPCFESLIALSLDSCHNLTTIPTLQALTYLHIEDCKGLVELPCFESLIDFDLMSCPNLTTIPAMKSLRTMQIAFCEGLVGFPCFPTLLQLTLKSCHRLFALPTLQGVVDLHIEECKRLVELPYTPSLRTLRVSKCEALESLDFISPNYSTFNVWLDGILSLESLNVEYCPEVRYPLALADDHGPCLFNKLPPSFDKEKLEEWFLGNPRQQRRVISFFNRTSEIISQFLPPPSIAHDKKPFTPHL